MVEITLLSDISSNNWPRDGMVDITDLKSVGLRPCEFDSRWGHQYTRLVQRLEPRAHNAFVGGSNPSPSTKYRG